MTHARDTSAKAVESFDVASFAALEKSEPHSFWFRARNRLIVSMLHRHFPDAENFLEIGTGTGFVLAAIGDAFPDLRLVGSDFYEEGLVFARRRLPNVELTRLDARALPFAGAFDVVGAFDVIEHIEEDELVLAQIAQALRPGGGVILLVPQHPRLWSWADEVSHHVRRYTRRELVGKVREAGFMVERVTSFVTTLLPVMVASRAAMRRQGRKPRNELVPGRLNSLFERALDLERLVIERGVPLPVGGSLLVVARRRDHAAE